MVELAVVPDLVLWLGVLCGSGRKAISEMSVPTL